MSNDQEKIAQLLEKIQTLVKRHDEFSKEIDGLRKEVSLLRTGNEKLSPPAETRSPLQANIASAVKQEVQPRQFQAYVQKAGDAVERANRPLSNGLGMRSNLEKFIGENLINKIGIIITVIGVGVGAKYAIDHQLISPLTRIILGYIVGLILFGFAVRLKKEYKNFSAVLLSGSLAVMYLITYAAYDYYGLLPNFIAFGLMVVFTAFTVAAAIVYDLQVIAHIGLVGAYAVPFLLSDGSGRVVVLFTYMSIINAGILTVAFKKIWKPLYYAAFAISWVIFLSWYRSHYISSEHFRPGLIFVTVFFCIFYFIFLAHRLIQKERAGIIDFVLVLVNSFIFYGIGYGMLSRHQTGKELLGLFTVCNAIVHFVVSVLIFRRKQGDQNLLYLVAGLVLVFLTIAVPVQLDGNWVTLLWAGEAALLFWIGRAKKIDMYEFFSYPMMLLAFFSMGHDWAIQYGKYDPALPETRLIPFLNVNFLTSLLFGAAFGFIFFVHSRKQTENALSKYREVADIVSFFIPGVLVFSVYFGIHLEISNYWTQLFRDSGVAVYSGRTDHWDYDLFRFRTVWLNIYTLAFVSLLAFINIKRFRNETGAIVNIGLILLTILFFLTDGLYVLSELRESYLASQTGGLYSRGPFSIGIRYVSIVFLGVAVFACHRYRRQNFIRWNLDKGFDFLLHVCILWVASAELINVMSVLGFSHSHKLGLSILWGSYSVLMIVLGIRKNKKLLRIWAIALFAFTLVKLFFFDLVHLDTIAKTIVLVSLGVLLLLISFLYIKHRNLISDEPAN